MCSTNLARVSAWPGATAASQATGHCAVVGRRTDAHCSFRLDAVVSCEAHEAPARDDKQAPTSVPFRFRLSEPGPLSSHGGEWLWSGVVSDRSAGARAYLGARPWCRRRDGRWVDPRGATPAARSLVDRRPWAGVAKAAGAGRKTGCHLGMVGLAKRIGGGSGDGLQGIGAELAQRVEAAPRELARDCERRPGVREPARLERQIVGAVGACWSAGRLG
jgi:hypothetical protein